MNYFCSEVIFSFVSWERLIGSISEFVLHLSNLLLINGDILGSEHWSLNENKIGIVNESAEEPNERLFKLIVALG